MYLRSILFVSFFCSFVIAEGSRELETKGDAVTNIAGLSWYLNMETALQRAKKEKKDMLIMIGEESCRWCKKMKNRTLTDRRIQEKLKSYILVSLKRSDKESIRYFPNFDGNIPSFFFMRENEEVLDSIVGYFKADDFLGYLNEVDE